MNKNRFIIFTDAMRHLFLHHVLVFVCFCTYYLPIHFHNTLVQIYMYLYVKFCIFFVLLYYLHKIKYKQCQESCIDVYLILKFAVVFIKIIIGETGGNQAIFHSEKLLPTSFMYMNSIFRKNCTDILNMNFIQVNLIRMLIYQA